MLFVLRSPPDEQGRSLGLDAALSAAAMDRQVTLLLAFPQAAAALSKASAGKDSPLKLLRAADLFGLQALRLLTVDAKDSGEPSQPVSMEGLPVPVDTVPAAQLSELIDGYERVFSYP